MDWNEVNKRINELPGCRTENFGQFCKICGKQIPMNINVEFCKNCKESMKRNGFIRVVRCKDCKSNSGCGRGIYAGMVICYKTGAIHSPDWFCADGERKDGDGDE